MNDLLERLAAVNPVPECEKPSIEEVWRKVAELDARPRVARTRRRIGLSSRPVRALPVLAALAIPMIVVLVVAIPLLDARHTLIGPTAPGVSHARTSLDAAAQRVAAQQLAGRVGAVVAIDPRTGAIKAMYASSSPGPATQAEYPPGAAFEIVTAAAALDSGLYRPNTLIAGPSPLSVSGVPLQNEGNESFGRITLTKALTYSVNTVFAQVGQTIGRRRMARYMKRFGFYSAPQLGEPASKLPASGTRLGGKLVLPTSRLVDLGRLAIGEGELAVTPLQMAMVAAAVADGGKLIAPRLDSRATNQGRVVKPATARELEQMMSDVVAQGTGTPAGVAGVRIAGKTGTAPVGAPGSGQTDPWFIGFAPASHPTIAIAVALQGVHGGFGGTDAAPIAAKVIEALLR